MATNFKIFSHRNGSKLHLKLIGDFDGSSAHELLNTMKEHCLGISRIFVHTSGLKGIHFFGLHVFHSHLCKHGSEYIPILFTGENANQLGPNSDKIFLKVA